MGNWVVEYVSFERFDFDIRRLANVEVVTPTPTPPLAPVTHADELMCEASEVKLLAEAVTNSTVDSQREAVDDGPLTSGVAPPRASFGAHMLSRVE